MEIAFDENGQHHLQVLMNPETFGLLQSVEQTPEQEQRFQEIMQRKKDEWMLSNVLGAYLDGIKEREFDLPFVLLLPALGLHDVHLTHGAVEYGTDFIAKKVRTARGPICVPVQSRRYCPGKWRNEVRGQLESAQAGSPIRTSTTDLSAKSFSSPRAN